ncbi:DNA mismatch repair protein [Plesiocystis pacifica SIR-1]|uniref:DNA mismatch repair protein MutS n=1 Tax=Plesiocystis pacifica SIR-1 TaxID=391625 RepID=A6G9B7_9BACT|nr:DNA mismatch repair protein MutS [Plesiocystis pacifica]EDM77539.1 DNA mismatch repair protein [Plesiocystis pacifica SIR-1]
MRQYLDIKRRYPDAIVMFRMGDFYELFFEDAVTVGPVLDIAVTTRDKKAEDPVPMAGVPYHAIGGYLRTLVERGYKVAIAEQMESPEEARKRKGPKIVRREVVRVVTPGALLDEEHLRGGEPNYLVALIPGPKGAAMVDGELPALPSAPAPGKPKSRKKSKALTSAKPKGEGEGMAAALAALDISSSEFVVMACGRLEDLRAELARLAPREILAPEAVHEWLRSELGPDCPALAPGASLAGAADPASLLPRVGHLFDESGSRQQTGLRDEEAYAAATALAYAEATQPGQTLLLHRLRRHEPARHLVLDETSLRNLEVFRTLRDAKRRGSLLWAIDHTRTSMGARMLRAWLGAPLLDIAAIRARQDGVEVLIAEARLRAELQSRLKDVRDVVRLAARARLGTISPRELGALRTSLGAVPELAERLSELGSRRTDRELPAVLDLGKDLLRDVYKLLDDTLVDDPPAVARDGGMIRSSADEVLAEQRELASGGRDKLAAIEAREREATDIPKLRIKHNNVFGYFLEVSKAHVKKVPKNWVRKQTLVNAERYVTDELAKLEAKILDAQTIALQREQALFESVRAKVSDAGERLVVLGDALARLDVLAGLAEVAEAYDYVRPELAEEPVLDINEGRHVVVERMLGAGRFVPNDTELAAGTHGSVDAARLWVVTGPNMGGKSTIMRQVALIAILAHVGSFVPAAAARVGLIDRVFTRVGAADDLGRGESTFMVEMRETAQIVAQASPRSLVLLDEIGRGTATFDGLALAWAITEHLHDQVGCRTMFATHYHELCGLEARLAGVRNVHVAVHEHRGKIVFLHRVEQGAAGRSYGIQVGRLAGLPARLLRRAQRILERLEAQERAAPSAQLDLFAPRAGSEDEAPVTNPATDGSDPERAHAVREVVDALEACDPDTLSPRDAHSLLYRLVDTLVDSRT